MNVGSTSVRVAKAASTVSAGFVPSTRNASSWWRMPPSNMQSPTTPLQTIMIAANTVSRASNALSSPPDSIIETMRATSMTVTAIARISVPKGSPVRWATTSA